MKKNQNLLKRNYKKVQKKINALKIGNKVKKRYHKKNCNPREYLENREVE